MTPEEAVEELLDKGNILRFTPTQLERDILIELINACVATAKDTERRRCAAVFRQYLRERDAAWGPGASLPPSPQTVLDEMLGGLEAEVMDGKIEP